MERLKWGDQRKIAEFVRDLYTLDSVKAISERVVQKLNTFIGATNVLVPVVDIKAKTISLMADTVGPELHKLMPVACTLQHEHPAIKYQCAHANDRAVTIGDLLPLYKWKKTAIFNEVFSRLDMQEQLSASLPFARPDIAAIVANRTHRTFTERDRSVMNILRFHISEACRTAKMHAAIPWPPLMEALEPLLGGSIIVLNTTGTVQFCSDLAQNYLETFFSTEKPFRGGLPLTVEKWVRQEITVFETNELAVRPPQPLNVQRGEQSLHIRLACTNNRTVVLFLRAEDPTLQLKKLSSLGLGHRATEVLYWLAKGKTNGEIGIILGARSRTIEKHVEGILAKLGVENRVAAALVATQGRL